MANGVETFLSKVGKGFKNVCAFLGSTPGQAAISGAETAATMIATAVGGPGLGAAVSGIEGLVNAGLRNVLSTEATAAALGAQTGTGTQKAAIVTASVASDAGAFLKSIGVSDPTDEEVQSLATVISTASANILNAIPARATAALPAPVAAPAA
jgi:hypothetical protein